MNSEEIKKLIYDVLIDMGIYIEKNEQDVDLTEYILNSLDYISFFIEIEDALGIELPDELLLIDNIKSMDAFSQKVYMASLEKKANLIDCVVADKDDMQDNNGLD